MHGSVRPPQEHLPIFIVGTMLRHVRHNRSCRTEFILEGRPESPVHLQPNAPDRPGYGEAHGIRHGPALAGCPGRVQSIPRLRVGSCSGLPERRRSLYAAYCGRHCMVKAPSYNVLRNFLPPKVLTPFTRMSINWMQPIGSPLKNSDTTVLLQGTGGVAIGGLQIAKACGLKGKLPPRSSPYPPKQQQPHVYITHRVSNRVSSPPVHTTPKRKMRKKKNTSTSAQAS